jgi:hypothetical protein
MSRAARARNKANSRCALTWASRSRAICSKVPTASVPAAKRSGGRYGLARLVRRRRA